MSKKCERCGAKNGLLIASSTSKIVFKSVDGKTLCDDCVSRQLEKDLATVILTTTNSIDGFCIEKYLGIESVEIVIGTGLFSEVVSDTQDFFGTRSTAFEKKLAKAKEITSKRLKYVAYQKGANAVVGIDLDYTEFSKNRVGLIMNGTCVRCIKHDEI